MEGTELSRSVDKCLFINSFTSPKRIYGSGSVPQGSEEDLRKRPPGALLELEEPTGTRYCTKACG
ncbi:hypothetical protein J6590_035293 [Homalodisca vitripennis]|nr:hypothetical protein J6590_035293 [Homalodisca vitripennis]